MSYVIASGDDRFEYDVLNKDLVLVDFYAEWCGPCKIMAPILEEVAREVWPGTKVIKVDIDENKYLSERYNIRNIPTMLLFAKGKEIARKTGTQEKNLLVGWLEERSS